MHTVRAENKALIDGRHINTWETAARYSVSNKISLNVVCYSIAVYEPDENGTKDLVRNLQLAAVPCVHHGKYVNVLKTSRQNLFSCFQ